MTTISGTIIFGVLGLIFGSFINAVVWRIHAGKSIAKGRSECVHCHHELGVLDLFPVISWLMLGGKCRYCKQPISVQYPLVELATAGLFALSYARLAPVGWAGWLAFAAWLYMLGSLIVLTVYDLRWMLLPNVVIFPALAVALVPVVINFVTGLPLQTWLGPIEAAILVGGAFYALAAVSDGKWMGGGDIKLVALIGLALGLHRTAVAMFIGFDTAALVSLGLLATGVKKRRDHIPFGPFLALGCVAAMLYGTTILNWYFTRL